MDKYEATIVMIKELEDLFKKQYKGSSDHDVSVNSIVTMVFSTINKSIEQLDKQYK